MFSARQEQFRDKVGDVDGEDGEGGEGAVVNEGGVKIGKITWNQYFRANSYVVA